jgi:prepilin-type processing-associated H-X9-DG protein
MSMSVNGLSGPDYDKPMWWIPSYQKLGNINKPSPCGLFVFIDVHEDEILDALFGIALPDTSDDGMWYDLPADRHSQGCGLTFADGHAERWKWKVPKKFVELGQMVSPGEFPDYRRVQGGIRRSWGE